MAVLKRPASGRSQLTDSSNVDGPYVCALTKIGVAGILIPLAARQELELVLQPKPERPPQGAAIPLHLARHADEAEGRRSDGNDIEQEGVMNPSKGEKERLSDWRN